MHLLELRVLGPIEAIVDGNPAEIGGPKPQALLACLAAESGSVVSTDALIDAIWGEQPPKSASGTLQAYVSRLRRALGTDSIRSEGPGYRLDADVDVTAFERCAAEAAAAAPHDPRTARSAADAGLALWRGRPFLGTGDLPALQPVVTRLEEIRLVLLEERLAADLALGRHAAVIGEIEELLEQHPWREGLWASLMTALVRSGRQTEALRAYQRAKRMLGDEMGIEPSSELRELEERILMQDTAPAPAPGRSVRSYELHEKVGEAPTGEVFRARQTGTGRDVALTIAGAEWADDPTFIRTFETGARVLSAVEHPHSAPVLDFWREPGRAVLARPWLSGGSLADRARPDVEGALGILDPLADALDAVHRQGAAHGAIDTSAVWLDGESRPYLVDFDLSAVAASAGSTGGREAAQRDDLRAFAALASSLLGVPVQDASSGHGIVAEARATLGRTTTATAVEVIRSPYKGLRPFLETDAADFHGRSAAVADLVDRLAASRFLTVVGPSGSGKSSLVHAGLIPALRGGGAPGSDEWLVTTMTPGANPFAALAAAGLRVADTPPADFEGALRTGLGAAMEAALPVGTETLLVIDQLEELYALASVRDRAAFGRLIADTVGDPNGTIRIVATLRADAYDGPLADEHLARLVGESTVAVVPMTTVELTEAITGPASDAGVEAEPTLVAAMVADVADEAAALPLLQFALTEVFERRTGATMTLEAYEEIGGIGGALARTAEAGYTALTEEAATAARSVFLEFVEVTADGQPERRVVDVVSLTDEIPAASSILDEYGRRRLLTFDRDPASRNPTVRIAHESLMREWQKLADWIADARDDLALRRRLAGQARDWEAADRDPAYLLAGSRLEGATSFVEAGRFALDPLTSELVAASQAAARREADRESERQEAERRLQRRAASRLRILVSVFAVAALVAGALSAFAFAQRSEAERQAARAEVEAVRADEQRDLAQRLADEARAEVLLDDAVDILAGGDASLALVLAREAADLQEAPTPAALTLLHSLVVSPTPIATIDHDLLERPDAFFELSPDGRSVLIGRRTVIADISFSAPLIRVDVADGQESYLLANSLGSFAVPLEGDELVVVLQLTPGIGESGRGGTDRLVRLTPDGATVHSVPLAGSAGVFEEPVRVTNRPVLGDDGRVYMTAETLDNPSRVGTGSILAMDPETGDTETVWSYDTLLLAAVQYTGTGSIAVAVDNTPTGFTSPEVRFIDLDTGGVIQEFPAPALISAGGAEFATARLTIRDAGPGVLVVAPTETSVTAVIEDTTIRYDAHAAEVTALALARGDGPAVTADDSGAIHVWDPETGDSIATFQAPEGATVVEVKAVGLRIAALVAGEDGNEILVWDLSTAAASVGIRRITDDPSGGGADHVQETEASSDAGRLGVFDADPQPIRDLRVWVPMTGPDGTEERSTVTILDVAGQATTVLSTHSGDWYAAAMRPDGTGIAFVPTPGEIWQTSETGESVRILSLADAIAGVAEGLGPDGPFGVRRVRYAPDGTRLLVEFCCTPNAAGFYAKPQLGILDLATGSLESLAPEESPSAPLWLEWSPDGRSVVSFGRDGQVITMNVDGGGLSDLRLLEQVNERIDDRQARSLLPRTSAAFHPSQPIMAVGGSEGRVHMWQTDTGDRWCPAVESSEDCGAFRTAATSTVTHVEYLADGGFLASGDTEGVVVVWDAATGSEHLRYDTGAPLAGIHADPDGVHLIVTTATGAIHTLTVDADEVRSLADARSRAPTPQECTTYALACE